MTDYPTPADRDYTHTVVEHALSPTHRAGVETWHFPQRTGAAERYCANIFKFWDRVLADDVL